MAYRKKKDITEVEASLQEYNQSKKREIIDLQNFYVNGKLENINQLVEYKKKEIVNKLIEYREVTQGKVDNPYLISNYFFKSINPLANIEPDYSSEKLAIIWSLYLYLIEQVNINIGLLQPTISHFCKFAGISVNKFKSLRNSGSLEMQILLNKISDETFDSNVLLAQNNKLSNRSTELRVKVENEVQEKPSVHVNLNVNDDVDLDQIASRLDEITKFKKSKKEIIEVEGNVQDRAD